MQNRKMPQRLLDNIISLRRLQVDISSGPSSEMSKFKQPAPKLAHCAFSLDNPALVKMDTE